MGIVYLAEKGCAGVADLVALKTIRTVSRQHAEILAREANLATQLRHENIVKTYGLEMLPIHALPEAVRSSFDIRDKEGSDSRAHSSTGSQSLSRSTSGPLPALEQTGSQRKSTLKRRRRRLGRRREKTVIVPPREVDIKPVVTEREQNDEMLLLIAMDYIEGTDCLRLHNEHLKAGYMLPPILAAYIISRVARALDYAHNFVVHRDLSPENVLINNQGVCKLTDFGIAVAAKEGLVKWGGKLGYMAPEQIFNKPVDERADIYALGLLAFTLTTGIPLQAPPKKGALKERIAVVKDRMEEGFPLPHRVISDIPRPLSEIIGKMIQIEPGDRYLRAAHVASDLEHKVLYAKGFGPTNDSLAAYMDIFDSGFSKYDENQLELLSFLKSDNGGLSLKRRLALSNFTRVGKTMISERDQYYICRRLAEMAQLERAAKTRMTGRPVLKVRLLDNVVETWAVAGESVIGSDSHCSIRISGNGVLPYHARVMPGAPMALKAEPNAPMTCNGKEAVHVDLQEGDRLQMGDTLMFYLHEPVPSAPKKSLAVRKETPSIDLLGYPSFELKVRPNDVEVMYDFWHELATQMGLGEQKQFLLANSLLEFIDLLSYGNDPVSVVHYQESGRVRFKISCESDQGFHRFTEALHEQLAETDDDDDEKLRDPKFMAIALIRKSFDRVDIDMSNHSLTLVKTF